MIRNTWYAVLESDEIGKSPVAVRRMGEDLVFWRDSAGAVRCLTDKCCHRGAALSAGEVIEERLQCPFHGLRFAGDGRCTRIPADGREAPVPENFRVGSYPTAEKHGFVYIYWGEPAGPLTEPPFFDDLDESFTYATVRDPWTIHYSRAIENQLDVAHLPFVHHNTIGRGGRMVVDGPVVDRLDENRFRVYVYNRSDDGTPPRPASVLPAKPAVPFHLEFAFPNMWQNHISEHVRIVVAFAPVDETNTILYLRFYQNFVRLPGLRTLFTKLAAPMNLVIAHQDRRVVQTQRPPASGLRIGENLIQADSPIVEYRRRREELKSEAARLSRTGGGGPPKRPDPDHGI